MFPQEHRVKTRHGPLSVSVYGDEDKPALVTYPDVALNHVPLLPLDFLVKVASLAIDTAREILLMW